MKLFSLLTFAIATAAGCFAQNATYGLPEKIQDGNILHCFNWSINDVKADLPKIAEAGFGAVQLSPLQRRNVQNSSNWSDVYRPYDFAFQATSALGSEADLKALCSEAATYGIKVIVDVVANHVDKTNGYHDPWWDSNSAYVRSKGGNANINYNNRYSITHDRLGDYYELNSENPEVIARAKAYVEWLRDAGVSGIRWDAAKHIALPSEGCDFWKEVTSVDGMFHYGEILGTPGPAPYKELMKEYSGYMSVTDSRYSESAAHGGNGVPSEKNGEWAPLIGADKLIYFGETHDTYSNTPDYSGWSSSVAQSVVDRAYATMACREGAAALYLSRPNASGFGNIRVTKGNDNYASNAVREVNRFRNKMNGRTEWFSTATDGTVSVTRNNGGAVIVKKNTGSFSVPNGGSLCPAGTYKDRISGNTITVTSTTISGATGVTGIVVIYNDDLAAPDPNAPVQEYEDGNITIYFDNSVPAWPEVYCHYWGGAESTNWPGVPMTFVQDNIYSVSLPVGSSVVFNNNNKGSQTVDVNNVKANHLYKATTFSGGKFNVEDRDVFSGVGDITADNTNFSVTAHSGNIHIDGLTGQNVTIASADGSLCHQGISSGALTVAVAKGIYIVKIGTYSTKIMVR